MKYVFITEFFECSSLALHMKKFEKADVKVIVTDKHYHGILDGIVDKEDDFVRYLGEKNCFVFDDASHGKMADSLRAKGEIVFGGSEVSDRLENDRSFGQSIMKQVGINTVESKNFKGDKAIDEAMAYIKSKPKKYVIKQNGDQDKSLSTVGKFDNAQDVIDRLVDMKHIMTENVDFDLQEFVDGHETAVDGWFNGKDWIRDTKGEPVFTINWEHKKKSEGDTGRTTGETCTLGYRTRKDAGVNKELLKMTEYLKKIKYIGNIDINFMVAKKDKKAYGLEFTNRFGYPYLNLQQEMFKSKWSTLLEGCASGKNNFMEVDPRWAVVIVLQVPPFPFETTKSINNAKGQRVYFLKDGDLKDNGDMKMEQLRHIHPYELKYEKESKHFVCSGETGYLLTVTAQGDSVESANSACLKYLKDNVFVGNMDFRKDCGTNARVQECIKFLKQSGYM